MSPPTEKDLSFKEAFDLAQRELQNFWYNSAPLVVVLPDETQESTLYALDDDFSRQVWLLAYVDPTSLQAGCILQYLSEWHGRYHAYQIHTLLILVSPYGILGRARVGVQQFLQRYAIHYPCVVDADGSLQRVWGAFTQVQIQLRCGAHTYFQYHPHEGLARTEVALQNVLRQSDPGLPLLTPFVAPAHRARGAAHYLFARESQKLIEAAVQATREERLIFAHQAPTDPSIQFSGSWLWSASGVSTNDPSALVSFASPGTALGLIAQLAPLAPPEGGGRGSSLQARNWMQIDFVQEDALTPAIGEDVQGDDLGQLRVELTDAFVYRLIDQKDGPLPKIVLRFPQAAQRPVTLYGLQYVQSTELNP